MRRPDVAILSSVHDVGDARLHRHVQALAARGLTVELWGTGNTALAPADATTRSLPRRGLLGRLMRAMGLPWRTRARVLVSVDPDVAIACGLRAGLSRRVIHVADVHEDYEALLRDRGWARGLAALPGRAVAVLGRRSAERATLTTVADTHLAPRAARRVVVRNVPSLPEVARLGPTPRAVYVGDVRASRGLDAMLDAVEAAPAWTLDIVGPIADADAERAAERAASLDGRVTFYGRLAPQQSWAIAAGAWAGFVMLDRTPAFLEATPSKLYEYLAHGIPVVATGLPAHEAIVAESRAGVIVADGAAAGEVLRAWSESPDAVRELSAHARQWASHSAAFAEGSSVLADRVAALVGGTHVG